MELTVEDVRTMIGGYVLELIGKDKEIAQLKAEIEKLKAEKDQISAIGPRTLEPEFMKERA